MHPEIQFILFDRVITLKSYSLFACLALFTGGVIGVIILNKKGLKKIDIIGIILTLVFAFFIGARCLNIIVNREVYISGQLSLFTIGLKGFSLYGGIIFAFCALICICRLMKIRFWEITDSMVIPFGTSFFIMRIGCFLNGCCYGKATQCFLGVPLPINIAKNIPDTSNLFNLFDVSSLRVHPTQLYEGILALIGAILICILLCKKAPGTITLMYAGYFSAVRWSILPLRQLPYPTYITELVYPVMYFIIIVLSIFLFLKQDRKRNLNKLIEEIKLQY